MLSRRLARSFLPLLALACAPALHAGRGLRTLAWRKPAPPWEAKEFTVSATENDTTVRITFLPPGGRSDFFAAKTGVASDPFANDVSILTFQIEIENRSTRTPWSQRHEPSLDCRHRSTKWQLPLSKHS